LDTRLLVRTNLSFYKRFKLFSCYIVT